MKTKVLQQKRLTRAVLLFLVLTTGMMKSLAQPQGALNGLFSVSATKQVYFSQGNLQYQASTSTWRFAENQYDYIGSANSNISSTYSGWIDLFGWGTSGFHSVIDPYNVNYQPWSSSGTDLSNNYNAYGYGPSIHMPDPSLTGTSANYDWGVYNPISNGGGTANTWRTLMQSEWDYLLNTRNTESGIRFARAIVNGINGVILLPDGWSAATYGLSSTNSTSASFSSNTISVVEWGALENAGAVFIPAAGYRSGTSILMAGSSGSYWTATYVNKSSANYVYFGSSNLGIGSYNRSGGLSVRLVRSSLAFDSYSIEAFPNPAEGGIVIGAGIYEQGQTCTLTATANEGYTFVNWTEDGEVVSESATYEFDVTGARTLVANFSLNSYEITAAANPEAGGTITGAGTYDHFESCTLTATAAEGYTFVNWKENGEIVSTEPVYSFTVTENRSLVANFSPLMNHWTAESYSNSMFMIGFVTIDGVDQASPTLELGAFCNGECRGSEISFEEDGRWLYFMAIGGNDGDEIMFRLYDHALQQELDLYCYNVLPFEGSAFIGLDDPYEVRFASSVTISAEVSPVDGGTVTGTGDYAPETSVTLVAAPNEGYAFNCWTLDGEVVSTEPSYTFTVTESMNFTAHFDVLQLLQLTAGWNWFSTYLEITKEDLQNALLAALPNPTGAIIKSQDGNSTYRGGRWRDQNFVWDVAKMYMINVPEDCVISLTGMPINPAEHPITIAPNTPTWFGFPFDESMTPAEAIPAGFAVNGDMIKGINGNIGYYGGRWRAQGMNILEPGQGYIYISKSAVSRTLIFPTSKK